MNNADKNKVQKALDAIRKAQSLCIDLMDEGILPDYSLDIPSLGEIDTVLENFIKS